MHVGIPYGMSRLVLRPPSDLRVEVVGCAEEVESSEARRSGVDRERSEIRRALLVPLASDRLRTIARSASTAVVVISDATRPCPSHRFLPALLDELTHLEDEAIAIVFALGRHRKHSPGESRRLVGEQVASRAVRLFDFDEEQCVFMGRTSRGTPLEVFRPYVEAELRICTGNIEPHYFAGFSGGAKAVLPGLCSRRTIESNHSMMLAPEAKAGVLEGNPVREDIDEAGDIVGIDFLFNVVLDEGKRIVDAVAGHYIHAHRAGVRRYERRFERSVDQPFDVVVASPGGHPKDVNLYQAQKTLENVGGVVRDGGVIILAARCEEGFGQATFEEWMLSMSRPEDLIERIQRGFVLGGHKAAAIAALLTRVKVYLISEFPDDVVTRCLMTPVHTLDEGLDRALQDVGAQASVLVVPHGRRVTVKEA